MISGNWCLYEKRSNRWLFHRRKRVMGAPFFTATAILAAGFMLFELVGRV